MQVPACLRRSGGQYPMGEKQNQPFQLSFNASLRIDFQGSRVTSDGGLILVRELDERLGCRELIEEHLADSRRGKNTRFPFADLLRQSVYSRLAGYEDPNDAERLSQDPTFPPLPVERGAVMAERDRLQPWESVAAAGAAAADRELVTDKPAAAAGEDRRP